MPDELNHSPLPWVVVGGGGFEILADDASPVAIAPAFEVDPGTQEANAALILRAVNAHADLLAACEAFVASVDGSYAQVMFAVGLAKAAIAKAKGGGS